MTESPDVNGPQGGRDSDPGGGPGRRAGLALPVGVASVAFLLLVAVFVTGSVKANGRFIYALDDAYIHLAMARSLAAAGVWGVTPDAFTASASSLVWPILLAAGYYLPGSFEFMPLAANVVSGLLLLWVMAWTLRHFDVGVWASTATLLVVIVVMPMASLAITGLEHLAHAAATLALAVRGAFAVAAPAATSARTRVWLGALALLVVATRFEGIFLVAIVAAMLLVRRDWRAVVILAAAAAAPLIVHGAVSMSLGWLFFPTSVVLKSSVGRGLSRVFSLMALYRLELAPHLFGLLIGVALLGAYRFAAGLARSWRDPLAVLTLSWVGATLLHAQAASLGWFYRYEAYLVAFGLVVLVACLRDALRAAPAADAAPDRGSTLDAWRRQAPAVALVAVALVVLAYPLARRGRDAAATTVQATRNIYEQQYQMALFLERYYRTRAVALNDIGTSSFLSGTRILDVYGLASIDVARLKLSRSFGPATLARLADERGVEVAIVFDSWLGDWGGVPPQWTKVAEWSIRNNIVCGDPVVAFYAVRPAATAELRENLRLFERDLPRGVRVAWQPERPNARR
jgi:hypothetical protein